jgi:ubiquinone/menaquinone biosynthesis C-methylase UbiE
MDSADEAHDYNRMDHSEVNRVFVDDLIKSAADAGCVIRDVLDLGTGTALIPIELCQRHPSCRIMAIDMSVQMLDLARYNVEAAGMHQRITLAHVDAKSMPYRDGMFDTVISNSIIHHIPEPIDCLRQMVRVTAESGLIFVRDLLRPNDAPSLKQLVEQYAGHENQHARKMFEDSLRAALSIEEIRQCVEQLGFNRKSVQQTTDRHWTWTGVQPNRAGRRE